VLAEIITIGDEILIGQIVDTNSAFLSKELNKIGVQVFQITSIQDERTHILQALKDAEKKADIVIVTVKALYKKHAKHPLLPESLHQALVPSTATVLTNNYGTAPGMWMEKKNTVFVSLPGVPFEMKHLLINEVIPRLVEKYHFPYIYHKTLLTYGMGESEIVKIIYNWEEELPSTIKLAYLPSFGRVRLRLSSVGEKFEKVKKAVDTQMEILQDLLKDIAIGFEDETTIVQRIAEAFIKNKKTLSIAESCTGGAIAEQITAQAGVSAFFMGSIVSYATKIKSSVLGVDKQIIKKHSVVSHEVVKEMALQSKKLFNTDFAIATTGVAGPSKGDTDDEVGTVFIAVAGVNGVYSEKFNFGEPRKKVIKKATMKALELLLKEILKN